MVDMRSYSGLASSTTDTDHIDFEWAVLAVTLVAQLC